MASAGEGARTPLRDLRDLLHRWAPKPRWVSGRDDDDVVDTSHIPRDAGAEPDVPPEWFAGPRPGPHTKPVSTQARPSSSDRPGHAITQHIAIAVARDTRR